MNNEDRKRNFISIVLKFELAKRKRSVVFKVNKNLRIRIKNMLMSEPFLQVTVISINIFHKRQISENLLQK